MDSQYAHPSKAELRSVYAAERNALDPLKREQWSEDACRHAAILAEEKQAQAVMVYVAFRSELDLTPFIKWCWQKDVGVIVPKCSFEDRGMTLHRLRSFDQLRPGAYGILEPDPALAPLVPENVVPELVLVPGLAFDRNGGRMGYGGGYYDRFWERMSMLGERKGMHPIWLGASFEAQLRDEVPGERHDLTLDGVITELGIYWSKVSD